MRQVEGNVRICKVRMTIEKQNDANYGVKHVGVTMKQQFCCDNKTRVKCYTTCAWNEILKDEAKVLNLF